MSQLSSNTLNAILDASEELIATLSTDNALTYVNTPMRRWLEDILNIEIEFETPLPQLLYGHLNLSIALQPALNESQNGNASSFTVELQGKLFQFRIKPLSTEGVSGSIMIGKSLEKARSTLQQIKSFNQIKKQYVNKLQSVFSTPLLAICIITLEEGFQEVNQAFTELTGYNLEEIRGRNWIEITHPEDAALELEEVQKLIKGEQSTFTVEKRYISKSGMVIPAESSMRYVHAPEGESNYFVCFIRDLTHQKQIETKNQILFSDISQYRKALENAALLFRTDIKGRITHVNEKLCNLSGYLPEELIGEKPSKLKSDEHDSEFFQKMWERITQGKTWYGEIKNKAKNGDHYWIYTAISPIKNTESQITEFMAICFDITQEKIATQHVLQKNHQLDELTQTLTRKNNQLQDFANIASHNLRTPISNLSALLHLMLEGDTDQELLWNNFQKVVLNLGKTVEDLTSVVKANNYQPLPPEKISFAELLDQTLCSVSMQIDTLEAEITSDFNQTPGIEYPRAYLESYFLNFVSNSLKYSSPERPPKLHIHTWRIEDSTYIAFKDNGMGIDLNRHGDKMFGLNKTFHKHHDSRGVGLYITKNQIESLGGDVSVESQPNVGTTFTLRLKRVKS